MTAKRPETASIDEPADSSELGEVVGHAPIHERDRIPEFMLNVQSWAYGSTSYRKRLVLGLAIVGIALVVAIVLSGSHLFRTVINELDIFAFVGLFLVNWIGNGGILVPIPGARLIGLLMIVQEAVIHPSWEVFAVSGAAMALGLLSYYIAGARTARAYQRGDRERAEELASDTGLMAHAGDGAAELTGLMPASLSSSASEQDAATESRAASRRARMMRRVSDSWEKAIERAQPVVEKHGVKGMFWLCLAPTPLGTAAAFVGGAMGFGFTRYMLASFASKYLLAGIIVTLALVFSDQASNISIDF